MKEIPGAGAKQLKLWRMAEKPNYDILLMQWRIVDHTAPLFDSDNTAVETWADGKAKGMKHKTSK